jgi:hypothetical protein
MTRLAASSGTLQKLSFTVSRTADVRAWAIVSADRKSSMSMDETARLEGMEIPRRIVTAIEVHPGSGRGKVEITVRGALAEILHLGQRQPGAVLVVAGERYQRYSGLFSARIPRLLRPK